MSATQCSKAVSRHLQPSTAALRAAVALAFAVVPAVYGQADRPPVPFEDRGACPFECCTYREWTVERDTRVLADRTDSAPAVFRVHRSETVEGLTGVVITERAGRAVVRRPVVLDPERKIAVVPGDAVYLLSYVGEAIWKFWVHGAVGEEEIPERNSPQCMDATGTNTCAVQIVEEPKTTWWAQIRNRAGRIGWTRQIDHFGNIDACG